MNIWPNMTVDEEKNTLVFMDMYAEIISTPKIIFR